MIASDEPTPRPSVEARFRRRMLRETIGTIAALAIVGGLTAGAAPAATAGFVSALGLDGDAGAPRPADRSDAIVADGLIRSLTDRAVRLASEVAHGDAAAELFGEGGVRLDELPAGSRATAFDLVGAALSERGRLELQSLMSADDIVLATHGGEWSGTAGYRIRLLGAAAAPTGFVLHGSALDLHVDWASGAVVATPDLADVDEMRLGA